MFNLRRVQRYIGLDQLQLLQRRNIAGREGRRGTRPAGQRRARRLLFPGQHRSTARRSHLRRFARSSDARQRHPSGRRCGPTRRRRRSALLQW